MSTSTLYPASTLKVEPTFTPHQGGDVRPEGLQAVCQQLEAMCREGDVAAAQAAAAKLAGKQARLSVTPCASTLVHLEVHLEDVESSLDHITIEVPPDTSIAQLKWRMLVSQRIPPEVQTWIIKKRIANDTDTLMVFGLKPGGAPVPVYLYLSSHHIVGLTREIFLQKYGFLWPDVDVGVACEAAHSAESSEAVFEVQGSDTAAGDVSTPVTQQMTGWMCDRCTLENVPTRPGCAACGAERPRDYVVPEDGVDAVMPHSDSERRRLESESQALTQLEEMLRVEAEAESAARDVAYRALVAAEDDDVILSPDPIMCAICLNECEADEVVVLRDCLHAFCRECLMMHISLGEEALVECPYQGEEYTCHTPLHHREIRALVSAEEFERFLARGLRRAEAAMANTFHCITPDCRGWGIYDDEENFFDCPVCDRTTCLPCRAQHPQLNCQQYQTELKIKATNDDDAKKTQDAIDELLRTGEAMRCPQCAVVLQKKAGCDWLRCSVCGTEICWVTRGARWGPAGSGDTSGGCRCRQGGKLCDPACGNCH